MRSVFIFLVCVLLIKAVCNNAHETVRGKTMLILLDGFRWDYFTPEMNGFSEVFLRGVKAEYMTPVFPTLTYPNLWSILTGLYTESHGMHNNFIWDEETDTEFLFGLNPEHLHPRWWDGGEPLWTTAERQGLRARAYHWPGCEVALPGGRPSHCVPYENPSTFAEFNESMSDALTALQNNQADFVALYFELTDVYGHFYGPGGEETRDLLINVDHMIKELLRHLDTRNFGTSETKLSEILDVIIVSDHGFTDISEDRSIRLTDFIDFDDIKKLLPGTPVGQIWPKPGREEKVYQSLKNAHPHIKVYKKEELPARWHHSNHHRSPPIFVVADIGWMLTVCREEECTKEERFFRFPQQASGEPYRGYHSYDNNEVDIRGIFTAFGPSFEKGRRHASIDCVDVYQLVCHILAIEPQPNNGTWSHVSEMLSSFQKPDGDKHIPDEL